MHHGVVEPTVRVLSHPVAGAMGFGRHPSFTFILFLAHSPSNVIVWPSFLFSFVLGPVGLLVFVFLGS